ncbi:long-chain fatty acid transport protein 4-like [Diadema setosum]|uniref:long-chain fatty acid transport protein 4-like n=1 Tax=Diadema setosum TaxID=31175 RepID=UPI003B3AACDA
MLFKAARVLRSIIGLLPSAKMVLKVASFIGLAAILRAYAALNWWAIAGGLFAVYLVTGGWKFVRVVIVTLPRDLKGLKVLIALKLYIGSRLRKNQLIHDIFRETVKRHPNKVALQLDDQRWSFLQTEQYSNAVGNLFFEKGFQKGDTVALIMDNRPEFFGLWLGLSKIGVISAFINYNLRKDGLAHCINVANCKAVIYASELAEAIRDALPSLQTKECYSTGPVPQNPGFSSTDIDSQVANTSSLQPPVIPGRDLRDTIFYIYTSGTTGLPKAAIITHSRLLFMAKSIAVSFDIRSDEVIYCALPLYHSAAGCLGAGQIIINGATMALRKKFSASNFWHDCIKYRATMIQYIGEICRYLYAQPHRPEETQHTVRLAMGNGLRPQLWNDFKNRFNITKIGEFYGATEGNGNIANMSGQPGAVGFNSMIAPWAYPVFLIKVDPQTGDIVRGPDGLCRRAQPGEPGQLVGKIRKGDPARDFHGYADKQANSKKVVYDVLKKGDMAFLSGDVLVMDDCGYYYFMDRSGDTFRWKGENVSTTEVEAIISNLIGLHDTVVYGVEVPGAEGRAGMAAIVDPNNSLNVSSLYPKLKANLPSYSVPLFLRMLSKMDTTGTFKIKKVQIRNEGFNVHQVKDKLFYLNVRAGKYEEITPAVYADIQSGKIKL